MTLQAFLVAWAHFMATHSCQVALPDVPGNGSHIVFGTLYIAYGGNCADAWTLAWAWHGLLMWTGASQGMLPL